MQLYVNELMVKKLSAFGAVVAVMLIYYQVWPFSRLVFSFVRTNLLCCHGTAVSIPCACDGQAMSGLTIWFVCVSCIPTYQAHTPYCAPGQWAGAIPADVDTGHADGTRIGADGTH